jgi:DNA helicase IV
MEENLYKALERLWSIWSPMLCQGWDNEDLANLISNRQNEVFTKSSPEKKWLEAVYDCIATGERAYLYSFIKQYFLERELRELRKEKNNPESRIETRERRANIERQKKKILNVEYERNIELANDEYNARQEEEAQEAIRTEQEARLLELRRNALADSMREVFERDYLNSDRVFESENNDSALTQDLYSVVKRDFIKYWVYKNIDSNQQLDHEQATAVGTVGRNVQVIARAGSGKTRTLVMRALFLQEHCKVKPGELLLLAFNKDAAEEMASRIQESLATGQPHVMTFHSLAYALVRPSEDLIYDRDCTEEHPLSSEIQKVIDENLQSAESKEEIMNLMIAHFREDWERIVIGRHHLSMEKFLAYRRSLRHETLNGDWVKSFGEKVVANTLFEHDVKYIYECPFYWGDVIYRPDFVVRTGQGRDEGIAIEYFGLEGDPKYDKQSEEKRKYWNERSGWKLIELNLGSLKDKGEYGFQKMLLSQLKEANIPLRHKPEEEIWASVRNRAIDTFTKAIRNFIGRCRQLNLSKDGLDNLVSIYRTDLPSESLFLKAASRIYRGYLTRISQEDKEDFNGLMWRAASLIREGRTNFVRNKGEEVGDLAKVKYIMIDEFQDFSPVFDSLIGAIRHINSNVEIFTVGDDWQAINAFAGSDLKYFTRFREIYSAEKSLYIRTNYRSVESVVNLSNALMSGRGEKALSYSSEQGEVAIAKINEFSPSALEQDRHGVDDKFTPAILRIIKSCFDKKLDVVMLSRINRISRQVNYNKDMDKRLNPLHKFEQHVRSFLPKPDRRRVTISSAHKYKGLQQSAVIVLDATEGSYPLIHPNWVFSRIFGDNIDRIVDEERRLFYVAITRAQKYLALISEEGRVSPFITEHFSNSDLTILDWNELAPVWSTTEPSYEIRVSDAFDVKEELKEQQFSYNGTGKYWFKSAKSKGFVFETLREESWARGRVKIAVYSEQGELVWD